MKSQKKNQKVACVTVCKKTIGDGNHIFMQKIDNEGKVTDGYHFIFYKGQAPKIYHTNDGYKYIQIDEEQKMLIDKVFEYYKLTNKAKLWNYDHDNISKFYRYLLFVKILNNQQNKIIQDIYDKSEDISLLLPDVQQELAQNKINEKKAEIFKQQLQLADKQTKEEDYMNDNYLNNLLILNAKANEIKLQEQAVKKKMQKDKEQKRKKLKDDSIKAIKEARMKLIQTLFPKNSNELPTIKTNNTENQMHFNGQFKTSKVLSIDISREKVTNNARPLCATLKLYDSSKKPICSFTIQQKHKNTYTITLTFGRMQYTQIVGAKSIDESIVKIDNTQQTLENITNLFYDKLSSYFGVEIQSEQKKIPSVFNVKDIEFINDQKDFPKHQQGYVDKDNTYQLIYEAHQKMCNCDKHYDVPEAKSNATKDLVLYYGGDNDEDERDKKENIFNNYCNNIKDFKKLENEVGMLSSLFGMSKDKNIHNANAYGEKNKSDKWREQHPDWQIRKKTKMKINNSSPQTIIEEKSEESRTDNEQNFFKKKTNNESEQKGFFDCLCCINGKDDQDNNEIIILDDNYNDINEDDINSIPIQIGKSMFAFAKKEKTKSNFNLLSCCMQTNKDEKNNEINSQTNLDNLIDSKIYEEILINGNNAKINDNNAKINIGNNNIINKK